MIKKTQLTLGLLAIMAIGVLTAPSANAAIITVDLGGEVLETGGVNNVSKVIDLGGTLGIPMYLNFQNSPSMIIRAHSANAYWSGNEPDHGGNEAYFQAADGTVPFPTLVTTFTRPTWQNGHRDGTEAGENFLALRTVDNKYGWLSFNMGDGTSTAITLNYFAYDDLAISPETGPSLVNGAVTPEPATMSMLALGGLAMLRRRRRKA